MALWKEAIGSAFLVIGHIGVGMVSLIKKVGSSLQSKDSKDFQNFIKKVKESFQDYLDTSLSACENQVNIQTLR